MKKIPSLSAALIILFVIVFVAYNCTSNENSKDGAAASDMMLSGQNGAFLNHRDSVPSQQQYSEIGRAHV